MEQNTATKKSTPTDVPPGNKDASLPVPVANTAVGFVRAAAESATEAPACSTASDTKHSANTTEFTQGQILAIRALLRAANAEDKAASQARETAYRHDTRARRKRIEAARLMFDLEQGGMDRMRIYKEIGISPKEGRYLWDLGAYYTEFNTEELDCRENDGRLLSINQAVALGKCAKLLNDEEGKRLIKKVRDDCPLEDPEFGPKSIGQIADDRTKDENNLRDRLGIEQSRIDELRNTSPIPPVYDAQFEDRRIVVRAPSFPLAFAALSKDVETTNKTTEFFRKGHTFIITRVE